MARKQKTIHYIYKTTCLVTNRYYIGMHSTCKIEDGYMGSGKRLRYSIRKHGIENHKKEIIKFFATRDLLIEAEKEAITPEMILDKDCMNLKEGGSGGFKEEDRKRGSMKMNQIILKRIDEDSEFRAKCFKARGDVLKELHRKGIVSFDNFKNKQHTDETKQLMSESSKGMGTGKTNSQYGTCWITKDGLNKKIKKEEIDKYQLEGWEKGRK